MSLSRLGREPAPYSDTGAEVRVMLPARERYREGVFAIQLTKTEQLWGESPV